MRGLFLENNNEIEIQNTEEISMVDKQNDYNENQIQVLEGLEAVRKKTWYVYRINRSKGTSPPCLRDS